MRVYIWATIYDDENRGKLMPEGCENEQNFYKKFVFKSELLQFRVKHFAVYALIEALSSLVQFHSNTRQTYSHLKRQQRTQNKHFERSATNK